MADHLLKIALTLVITVLLLFLTIFFAGGGHGTYLPAKLIYPYTMLCAAVEHSIGIFGILLAIVQIPIYTLINFKKPKWTAYVLAIHCIAVLVVLAISNNGTF